MALILALNPGNSHSPTLSRLARELQGCELIGADSSAVAITAIKGRVPDVLLLPAKTARGEADLMAHLKSIPGGVLTLKLPPVESADPIDLARQIREMLTGIPVVAGATSAGAGSATDAPPRGASPHLRAAAIAAINWIRARRTQWADERPRELAPEPAAQWAGASPEPRETYEPIEPLEPLEPHATRATFAAQIKTWLPRAAALAVVLGIAAAGVSYWPQIRGVVSSTVGQITAPREVSRPVEMNPKPVVPQPAAEPEPDPLANVSGWVAVFAPFDISISEGNRGLQVDDRGRAMLAPGRHRLRFQNRELGYDETRTVEVRPTETTTINLIPQTTIAVTSSEPAEVVIDGTRAGDTPYDGKIGLGTHSVTVRAAGAERQLTVEATSKPVQLDVDFSKP